MTVRRCLDVRWEAVPGESSDHSLFSQVTLEQILSGTPTAPPKTKIICTLGPKSQSVPVLEELLRNGGFLTRSANGGRKIMMLTDVERRYERGPLQLLARVTRIPPGVVGPERQISALVPAAPVCA